MKRFVIGLTLLATASATLVTPVLAQTKEQKAGARNAAEAGADAFDAGNYAQAADLFDRAEQLVHAPPHLLYGARSHVKLGHLLEARELYLALARDRLPDSAPRAFREAQQAGEKELADVEQRLAYVSVVVQGATGARDLQVTRDDEPISAALIGIPSPINPGEYSFRARAEGLESKVIPVKLAEGARETVVLTLQKTGSLSKPGSSGAATPTGGSLVSTLPQDDTPGEGRPLLIASIASFGLAAVGGALGTVFWLKSNDTIAKSDALDKACRPNCNVDQSAFIAQTDSDAQKQRAIAIGGVVTGGVGLAAGVILLVLDQNRASSYDTRLAPTVGFNHVGLIGRF